MERLILRACLSCAFVKVAWNLITGSKRIRTVSDVDAFIKSNYIVPIIEAMNRRTVFLDAFRDDIIDVHNERGITDARNET